MKTGAIPLQKRVRLLTIACVVIIALSGITALPLTWELNVLARMLHIPDGANPQSFSGLHWWIATVRQGLIETDAKYPFLAYGTDWLAFGHLVIASAFYGVWRDATRNIWIVEWAMIACVAVIPLALICGPLRGIPFGWQLVDCSFGVVGFFPLLVLRRWILQLAKLTSSTRSTNEP